MAPRPRWPAGFQRNVLAAAKRLRGCAAPKNPQSVRASNVAPHPSVRSGRPDFIILTPPRNSSHPSFFFFFLFRLRDRASAPPRRSGAVRQEAQRRLLPPPPWGSEWGRGGGISGQRSRCRCRCGAPTTRGQLGSQSLWPKQT